MTSEDRFGDPKIKFPVAFAYGDRDWLGSANGADHIVSMIDERRNNDGLSQLFVVEDSDHMTYLDNTEHVVQIMLDFFLQRTTHCFEVTPRISHIKVVQEDDDCSQSTCSETPDY